MTTRGRGTRSCATLPSRIGARAAIAALSVTMAAAVTGVVGGPAADAVDRVDSTDPADNGVHVGGPVLSDTTWTADAGPYVVDKPVQVADNVTLTIEAGAEVLAGPGSNQPGTGTLIEVAGTLDVAGRAADPVAFDGGTSDNHAYGLIGTLPDATDADIRLAHVEVSDFDGLAPPNGHPGHANYTITDSTFTDLPEWSYFWYPTSYARVERNLFINVGTLSFGTDANAVATVVNNRFRGASSSTVEHNQRAVESWAAYGQPLQLHGNTFEPSPKQQYAVVVSTDGVIDASANDWATTDPAVVENRILDRNDDLTRPSVVDIDPLLTGPAAATPAAPPSEPRGTLVSARDHAIYALWDAPVLDGGSPVAGYTVTATPDGAGAVPVTVQVGADTHEVMLEGLVNGVAYRVTVTATNAAGSSSTAPSVPVTPAGLPGPPGKPTATVHGRNVTLTWPAADPNGSPVVRYQLQTVSGPSTKTATTRMPHATLRKLRPGKYLFTVTATNAVGTGQPSRAVKVKV